MQKLCNDSDEAEVPAEFDLVTATKNSEDFIRCLDYMGSPIDWVYGLFGEDFYDSSGHELVVEFSEEAEADFTVCAPAEVRKHGEVFAVLSSVIRFCEKPETVARVLDIGDVSAIVDLKELSRLTSELRAVYCWGRREFVPHLLPVFYSNYLRLRRLADWFNFLWGKDDGSPVDRLVGDVDFALKLVKSKTRDELILLTMFKNGVVGPSSKLSQQEIVQLVSPALDANNFKTNFGNLTRLHCLEYQTGCYLSQVGIEVAKQREVTTK